METANYYTQSVRIDQKFWNQEQAVCRYSWYDRTSD